MPANMLSTPTRVLSACRWSPGCCSRSASMNGWRPGIRSGSCSPASALVAAARELVGLLDATSARPSANSVIGGVLALAGRQLAAARRCAATIRATESRPCTTTPREPLDVLAWPFLCFVAVLMVSFVVQSLQFEKPGPDDGQDRRHGPGRGYVGLLGSFTIQMRWFEGRHKGSSPWCSWSRRPRGPTPVPTRWAGSPAGTSSGRRSAPRRRSREPRRPGLRRGGRAHGRGDRPLPAAHADARLAQSRPFTAGRRRGRPARRPDGVDDQARLRAQGCLRRRSPASAASST